MEGGTLCPEKSFAALPIDCVLLAELLALSAFLSLLVSFPFVFDLVWILIW